MVTASNLKVAPRFGKGASLGVFDPGSIDTQRDFVFGFTGRGTGMAADALPVVDDEAVIHAAENTAAGAVVGWAVDMGFGIGYGLLAIYPQTSVRAQLLHGRQGDQREETARGE